MAWIPVRTKLQVLEGSLEFYKERLKFFEEEATGSIPETERVSIVISIKRKINQTNQAIKQQERKEWEESHGKKD